MHSTLMIFIDGVGIGSPDPAINPFFRFPFRIFNELFGQIPSLEHQNMRRDNIFLFPVDACLDTEGLPQSGTGQVSIFCGVNAAKLIGQHFGPYPYSTLLPVLTEENIFKKFMDKGHTVAFVNAYPQLFFDYVNSGKQRLSATTMACRQNKMRLNDYNDLKAGNALSAEIDNSRWVTKMNYDLPILAPETAAERLMTISRNHTFTMFEYYLTDHLGHGRIKDALEYTLRVLDQFLFHILTNIDESEMTLIICSDHGNLEDLSVKGHTVNPALTITAGKFAASLASQIRSLPDIQPAILRMYG
ncbi:MAG: alkaline phosphatase family protein [Methanococcaceae archaeon]